MSEVTREVKTFEVKYECDEEHCREWQIAIDCTYIEGSVPHACYSGHHAILDRKYPYTKTVKV